jgi:predicted Zn-dependent peptidase
MQQLFQLPGGLRLLVEELPHVHSVAVGCFVGVGSGHEQRSAAGIAHFIEHMLFKGSARYPSTRALSDAVEGLGGVLDAYTEFDTTVYYAKVPYDQIGRAVDVLADMLLHPLMRPEDVEKERRVITEELRQTDDTPSDLVHGWLDEQMWGDQPLGRDIAGDEDSVAGLTHAQIVGHWQRHYTTENIIISVAGRVDAAQVAELIGTALADLPRGAPEPPLVSAPPLPGPAVWLASDESEQSNFCLGFPGLAKTDPDRRALLVLDTILGGGMSSRLFQRIREDLALAYSVGSYTRAHHDAGKWVVYGSVEPERLHECIAEVLRELRAVLVNGVTEAELRRVKDQTRGGVLLSLEDTWSVAARNGGHLRRYGRVLPVDEVVAQVEQVTLADLQRVAARVLRFDTLHLAIIGPHTDITAINRMVGIDESPA